MRLRRIIFLYLLIISTPFAAAQSDDDAAWGEIMELWADQNDNETIPDDLAEQLLDLCENPVNINDTNYENLSLIPFLTDFQRKALCAYILQNGQLVSLNELFMISALDTNTIRMLRRVSVAEPVKDTPRSLRELLKQGHNTFVTGTKSTFPRSRGYQEDIYLGSPYRFYFKYAFKSGDRISFQLSGDKDAGEMFYFGQSGNKNLYGLDYYGYHLMLNKFGRLKKTIVGKYHLQFGQGATLWSGYAPWFSGTTPLYRYNVGIRPASAFCEYGFLRGAATTIALMPEGRGDDLDLTLFYSNVDRDATASSSGDSEQTQTYQSIYQSGYHRTSNELSKKGNLNEQLYGGNLRYRNSHISAGATAYATVLDKAIEPAEYVYNHFAFRGKNNFNFGVDASYSIRNFLFFGEAAMSVNETSFLSDDAAEALLKSDWMPLAAVVGMHTHLASNNTLSAVFRYGSPTYHNLHADLIGQGSSVANERCFLLLFKTHLPFYIHLVSSASYSYYPTLRYNVYAPSSGVDYYLDLSKEIAHNTLLEVKYRYKQSQRNRPEQTYQIETVNRQQLQATLDYRPSQQWRMLSRVVYCRFNGEVDDPKNGFLVFHEISWNGLLFSRPVTAGLRLSMFDVDDYDARIYSYERDLQYEYGVPMLMGRGMRCFVVGRYSITPRITLALKYTLSYYPDQQTVGSGYEKIEGNKRQEIKAQLRLNF